MMRGKEEAGVGLNQSADFPWAVPSDSWPSFNQHRAHVIAFAIPRHNEIPLSASRKSSSYLRRHLLGRVGEAPNLNLFLPPKFDGPYDWKPDIRTSTQEPDLLPRHPGDSSLGRVGSPANLINTRNFPSDRKPSHVLCDIGVRRDDIRPESVPVRRPVLELVGDWRCADANPARNTRNLPLVLDPEGPIIFLITPVKGQIIPVENGPLDAVTRDASTADRPRLGSPINYHHKVVIHPYPIAPSVDPAMKVNAND